MRLLPFEYAARNLGRSRLRLALSVGGSALVVLLVIAAGAFVRGMTASLTSSGSPRNVIVLGAGSEESVERSEIPPGAASEIAASVDGIMTRLDVPYVSSEIHVGLPLTTEPDTETSVLTVVRGVTPAALLVQERVQITEGRFPDSGNDEVMVGRMVAAKMGVAEEDLALGRSIYIDNRPWTIVGRFAAPGTVMDAEVWAPLTALRIATKRETDSCVILTLDTAAGAEFADIDAFTKQRLDLELVAMTESEYYDTLTAFYGPVRIVAWATAGLIGLGGLFGGLNTMYAAFASRVRELGMLQCLGYRRAAVVASLVQESVLATSCGALIGCALGLLALDGVAVRFTMGAFGLSVDATVIVLGLLAGLALGLIGALPPAWRALRLPIPEALKSF